MSFAGHVYDMIRRNKEDRENLKRLRKHSMEDRLKYASNLPDISAEEFEELRQQTKTREQRQERLFFRMTLLVYVSVAAGLGLLYFFLKDFL